MKAAQIIPLLIGSSGLTAVAAAIFNAILQRGKLKAEASSIISEAAGGLVTNYMNDNVRLRSENAELLAEKKALEDKVDRLTKALADLTEYSARLAKAFQTGGSFDERPPKIVEF